MEIELAGHTYVIGTMKSRQQRNVLRRVFPLLLHSHKLMLLVAKAVGPMAHSESAPDKVSPEEVAEIFSAVGPMADAFGAMKDEDCDYVFETCLAVVKRRVPGGLTDIVVAGGDLRYEDILMPQQLQLVFAVMKANFSDFFSGLPGLSPAVGMAGVPSS